MPVVAGRSESSTSVTTMRSPAVASIVGPGIVPLYVHAS